MTAVPLAGFPPAVRAGQFELARERLAIQRATAEKLGQPIYLWVITYTDASVALLHGDGGVISSHVSLFLERTR